MNPGIKGVTSEAGIDGEPTDGLLHVHSKFDPLRLVKDTEVTF